MRVLTWNVWWRFGPWEERRKAILTALRDLQPDAIGLQEVWSGGGENLAEWLASNLDMHWTWAASRAPASGVNSAPTPGICRPDSTRRRAATPPPGGPVGQLQADGVTPGQCFGDRRAAQHGLWLRRDLVVGRTPSSSCRCADGLVYQRAGLLISPSPSPLPPPNQPAGWPPPTADHP
ncbi:endonuclease/exonuclease/phosphatase family protein [Streptomyces sp. 3N207]|uniref:endonuclease/exonuclease/phosphatase family protein n=1 Tax=Streptomyces sp. 3N207 TaxID=3457417 RepID=UPI003FD33B31